MIRKDTAAPAIAPTDLIPLRCVPRFFLASGVWCHLAACSRWKSYV